MCARYELTERDIAYLRALHGLYVGQIEAARFAGGVVEIRPTERAPALASGGAFWAAWGIESPFGSIVINARAESLLARPLFRSALEAGRIALPASAFFEWKAIVGGKEKVRFFARADRLFFAGVMRGGRFAIATRAANNSVRHVHDRMPVILDGESLADWLDPSTDAKRAVGIALEASPALESQTVRTSGQQLGLF